MSSISQSYKTNPVDFNHLIPLDFNGVANLPNSHERIDSTEQPVVDSVTCGSLPLIDLCDPNAMSLIRQACEKWGVFQVINHGIPLNLLEEVEVQCRLLFSLTTQQKLAALRPRDGITGYGMPQTTKFFPKLMWTEGFSIIDSPMEDATKLWPNQPDQQTKFCDVMEKYQTEMKAISERMTELMLGSLGLTLEDIQWFKSRENFSKHQAVLQLNSYPACPDADRVMGRAPHTDTSLLTVLNQCNAIGLQVLADGIGWVPVPPINDALVVNLGDLMQILSNGQFKSILHRGLVNKTHHRISTAYFFGPPSDVEVSPLRRLIDHDHPPLYSAVTWKEYLQMKAIHFNNALKHLRNKSAAKN